MRLAQGEMPAGMVVSEQINDLDSLPFPRWDLVTEDRGKKLGIRWSSRPVGPLSVAVVVSVAVGLTVVCHFISGYLAFLWIAVVIVAGPARVFERIRRSLLRSALPCADRDVGVANGWHSAPHFRQ